MAAADDKNIGPVQVQWENVKGKIPRKFGIQDGFGSEKTQLQLMCCVLDGLTGQRVGRQNSMSKNYLNNFNTSVMQHIIAYNYLVGYWGMNIATLQEVQVFISFSTNERTPQQL